jgi:S-methylmethionine-dependent homocysteine/selenocysteine methylase
MRHSLPQLDRLFLTDGGVETDLIFNRGIDLPYFASVMLLRNSEGEKALDDYIRPYLDLARRLGTGFEFVTASWRASPDWAAKFGLSHDQLDELNRKSVERARALQAEYSDVPSVISGCIGPRGDGYDPGKIMTAAEAQDYHRHQISTLASAGVDLIAALTMTNIPEAVGIAEAAKAIGIPVAISFTVETDGRLPTGDSLRAAIEAVDEATDCYPAYYMINCAHPTHFMSALSAGEEWTKRIGGIRANASRCSHAELDAMTELDCGDPDELGRMYRAIRDDLPGIRVIGGCCGTDLRHVTAIAEACVRNEETCVG